MNKSRFSLSLVALVAAVVSVVSLSVPVSIFAKESTMEPVVISNPTGPHFRAGETVVISEDLEGDVYVAGGTVRVEGSISGDLLVVGGQVTIVGDVSDDVRAFGGTVTLDGTVGKNVTVAGGTVLFGANSIVLGSVVSGSGMLDISGEVDGASYLGASTATVAGLFNQNVTVGAQSLTLSDLSSVGGSLYATVPEDGSYVNDAVILGETKIERPVISKNSDSDQSNSRYSRFGMANAAKVSMSIVMGLVGGGVLLWLFADAFKSVAQYVVVKPVATLGFGFVVTFLAPVALLVLALTVIGLPIAALGLLVYIFDFIIARWVASYAVGIFVAKKSKWAFLKSPFAQFGIGLLIFELLAVLPILGGVVHFVTFLMAMGALWMWTTQTIVKK